MNNYKEHHLIDKKNRKKTFPEPGSRNSREYVERCKSTLLTTFREHG
jgi:hypothetical protein